MKKLVAFTAIIFVLYSCNSGDRGELVGTQGQKWHPEKPFGMALIHDMDATKKVIDVKEEESKEKDFIPHFNTDKNGNIISVYSEKNGMFDNKNRSANFDYKFD